MTEATDPVLGTVLGQIRAARKAVLEILSLVGVISGFGSLLVLVVHSMSIGYLPDADLADIGTVLGIVLFVGLLLVVGFLMLVVAPAVLMFLGLRQRSHAPQDREIPREKFSKLQDMPAIKAGVMLLLGAILLFIGIWFEFYCGVDQWWLIPSAILLPALLSVALELVCGKRKPNWVEITACKQGCWASRKTFSPTY